jgi:hypothetical protein
LSHLNIIIIWQRYPHFSVLDFITSMEGRNDKWSLVLGGNDFEENRLVRQLIDNTEKSLRGV